MYIALTVLMGTTWHRMDFEQQRILDRMIVINFSVAFLAFMAVAGITAFLEERHVFFSPSNGKITRKANLFWNHSDTRNNKIAWY